MAKSKKISDAEEVIVTEEVIVAEEVVLNIPAPEVESPGHNSRDFRNKE